MWVLETEGGQEAIKMKIEAERQKAAEAERQKAAEAERQKAEAERQKAEAERQKAEAERQKAEAERQSIIAIRRMVEEGLSPMLVAKFFGMAETEVLAIVSQKE
jgi:predicted ribosome quality control (RQC) complex YloA/Tae2 family protein